MIQGRISFRFRTSQRNNGKYQKDIAKYWALPKNNK